MEANLMMGGLLGRLGLLVADTWNGTETTTR